MYTIKHAAELTGVPVATLRAWERRYDVFSPDRTDSGYRVYVDSDITKIKAMDALVKDGWSPAQAAASLARGDAGPPDASPDAIGTLAPPAPPVRPADVARPQVEQREPVAAHRAPSEIPADIEEFLTAAEHKDGDALAAILDDRFMRAPFETTVDEWLLPALRSLLEASSNGRMSAMGEHMASHAVMRRVAMAFESTARSEGGPRIVVGLPPGARHELGSLSIATVARRAGLSVTYLGRDLTLESWREAIMSREPRAIIVMAVESLDTSGVEEVLAIARATRPAMRTIVAGRFTQLVPDPVERFGPMLGRDTKALAAELHSASRPQ